eukprot:5982776-Pleurochrysis_carterae.AAC.2
MNLLALVSTTGRWAAASFALGWHASRSRSCARACRASLDGNVHGRERVSVSSSPSWLWRIS